MKTATIILACLLFTGCATLKTDPWTKEQIILQGVASGLNIIDWGQTLDIADKPEYYYEINPALGEHPSRAKVNRYFVCSIGLKILITHVLPTEYRNYWLGGNIMISGYLINHNYRVELRINF